MESRPSPRTQRDYRELPCDQSRALDWLVGIVCMISTCTCAQSRNLIHNVTNGGFWVREVNTEEKYVQLKPLSQFEVLIPETFTH